MNDRDSITHAVRQRYASVAQSGLSSQQPGVRRVAAAMGYSNDQLAAVPAAANLGVSCGNPTQLAALRAGETVVDLGCGGGLDVLLAARQVGPAGRVIGIDMTPEMIELARRNAASAGTENVEFHLATIDQLPLPTASVDCILSNCVINLAPDKAAVFREMYRVLKPAGRVAVSDIALKQPLPDEVGDDLLAYAGCIAGALAIDAYRALLADAGFEQIEVVDEGADLHAYAELAAPSACATGPQGRPAEPVGSALPILTGSARPIASGGGCCTAPAATPSQGPSGADSLDDRLADLLVRYDVNAYAASVRVVAVKPARR